MHKKLRKPTDIVLKEYGYVLRHFANEQILNVYSFGFSFSNVDKPYIQEICYELSQNHNVIWWLHDYDSNERREEFVKVLRDCGFKREIRVFNA